MHALWDQLLGRAYDASDVRRRASTISENAELDRDIMALQIKENFHDPVEWVRESRELALQAVYTDPVLEYVQQPEDQRTPTLVLSQHYLKAAGEVSQSQACIAARRLSNAWRNCLHDDNRKR
jgi:hypothetical protein